MGKVSITINGAEVKNVYPAITIGVSAAASGDDVIFFVLPSGLPAFVKGTGKTLLFCMDDGSGSHSAQIQF